VGHTNEHTRLLFTQPHSCMTPYSLPIRTQTTSSGKIMNYTRHVLSCCPVFTAMAALGKWKRVARFGNVLLRNETLFIRPPMQKPLILKQQLTGNRRLFYFTLYRLTLVPSFAFPSHIWNEIHATQISSVNDMQLFCCDWGSVCRT
jgi:hypothetical protein